MTKSTTITINGRLYDAVTGMPLPSTPPTAHKPAKPSGDMPKKTYRAFSDVGSKPAHHTEHQIHPAQNMHQAPQRSQTLYRKALKKPAAQHEQHVPAAQRSPLISKFGTSVAATPQPAVVAEPETPNVTPLHPAVAKVLHNQAAQKAAANTSQPTGTALKEQLIKERLAAVGDAPKKVKKRSLFKRQPRVVTILVSTLALLVLGGYLTYMNLPVISMKVAASRAGVSASLPNYQPDGYRLDGPITYSPGQVNINYKSNTNSSSFKLAQKASNWDSQALLDNYVTKQTDTYLTFQEGGVTVYTFNNKAAWVNGGILYTVDGNAGLSSEQILRLTTSM